MDKKKILLLVGVVAAIVIVAVVTQYLAMQSDSEKDTVVQPSTEESQPVVFTANSYSGTVQSIDAEKIVIVKEDGSAEEYQLSALYGVYDNRVRDEMKPIEAKSLTEGMPVQVSTTLNNADDTKAVSLTLYK